MDFSEVIKKRRSIRKFKDEPVPMSMIRELIDAGRLAPSGLNVQPWRYLSVNSKENRDKIAQAIASSHAATAPVLLICCADMLSFSDIPSRIKELITSGAFSGTDRENSDFKDILENRNTDINLFKVNMALNAAISIDHIILKATDLGLGSCWLGVFDEAKIKELTGLNDRYYITAVIAVGYPDQSPPPRPRLHIDEILIGEM